MELCNDVSLRERQPPVPADGEKYSSEDFPTALNAACTRFGYAVDWMPWTGDLPLNCHVLGRVYDCLSHPRTLDWRGLLLAPEAESLS